MDMRYKSIQHSDYKYTVLPVGFYIAKVSAKPIHIFANYFTCILYVFIYQLARYL